MNSKQNIERDFNIKEIESLTEEGARAMAMEKMVIKEHNIYFVDLRGYFGYSALVFKNNHHIYYANDYALHHQSVQTVEELRSLYIDKLITFQFSDSSKQKKQK